MLRTLYSWSTYLLVLYAEPVTVEDTAASVCLIAATLWLDVGACVAVLAEAEVPDVEVSDVVPLDEHESPEEQEV